MTENYYSKVELAIEQLENALWLFLDHSAYASTITLAGAAEEVFGRKLQRDEKPAVLDWKLSQANQIYSLLHGNDIDRKKFLAEENEKKCGTR